MVCHLVLHAVIGIAYRELGGDQHVEEVSSGEFLVLIRSVRRFELCHAVEETQEEGRGVHRRVNALVAKFSKEATISIVD